MIPDKIEKLCLKAREAIEQRDWARAKQAYLLALGHRSDLPDIHYGLATVYFQLRELTSAAHHFREVTRLDPLRAGAYINLGAVLNLLEQLDEAIAALRRGIQLDPQRVEGYYNLGLVCRRKGQNDLAIESYREALRLNPRMADACMNLGNLYLEKGQHSMAQSQYQQALRLRPGWEKALDGIRFIQETTMAAQPGKAAETMKIAAPEKPTIDLERPADPVAHQGLLTNLHQATVVCEEAGRKLQQILADEVEPAIKELSTCLLYPDTPLSEMESCIHRFEKALEHVRSAESAVMGNMDRLRHMSESFPDI